MKIRLFILLLTFSQMTLADMVHHVGIGAQPNVTRLRRARSCFQEIKELGCGHPREDQISFNNCLIDREADLTSDCQSFFKKLYGKR